VAWAAAPMVVKLAVGLRGAPAGRGHQGAAAFAAYVATREGVARAAEEPAPDPIIHARYLGERPGSTGLFGSDPAAPPDLEAVQGEIGAAAWWQSWVVSMRGPDAEAAGLATPQDWRAMVRRAVPQVAATMGVAPQDLRWVAAVHRKVGRDGVEQPHVHVLVWPASERAAALAPRLPRDRLRAAKKAWAREVFGAQRAAMAAERTAQRDLALGAAKAAVATPVLEAALAERLGRLAAAMPGRGRAALAYMPPEAKRLARDVAEWLLSQPDLAEHAASVVRLAGALAEQRAGTAEGRAAARRAREDLRDRVAQVVLRAAAPAAPPPAVRARPSRVVEWARGGVAPSTVGRIQRLVRRVADGAASPEALQRALGGGPRGAAAAAILLRRERLARLRPADAVAERLGVGQWADEVRHEVDQLLRRAARTGDAADVVGRVRDLVPEEAEARVRRAVAAEARRARAAEARQAAGARRAAGVLAAVRREIERARAEAEWETTRAGEAAW
jgi:hypothetical protein